MTGLSSEQVRERMEQGLYNEQVDSSTRTVEQIIKDNIFTYFNLIFTVLAVLLIMVGSFRDLTFMFIVVINTAIGIFQEIKSKRTLDNLKFMKMPKVKVIRDGVETEVATKQLVLGDAIILESGSQIPADAQVEAGQLKVNESMLTGESDEIEKGVGDQLLSGSFVVSGQAVAVLTAVGRESYIAKLTIEATKEDKDESSEMIRSLDRLVKAIGIIIIPVGVVLFVQEKFIMGNGFRDSVIGMVAAVLGMIPEGLYMTASIAMVVSAMRLAKKDVLVQNMKCIETLARVDVLCVDKTGTITENTMKVSGYSLASQNMDSEHVAALLGDFASAQNKDNITMAAMQDFFTKGTGRKATSICSFSSEYKYSGASFGGEHYVLGAPEFVLRDKLSYYQQYIDQMGGKGYRVLAFASIDEKPEGQRLTMPAQLIALVFLANPIREGAPDTFKFFGENDVEIKVISGDNPVTVSNVAGQAGILNAEKYIDASSLETDDDIETAVAKYTVFGRVTPEQKLKFVKALKEQGRTVGMTGDGVNDILALRDADCSVAMASGSQAASNAAQLVLMDSDFAKMPKVVAEGRRVVNNLQKAAALYLTKNIFSFLLAIFSMISVLAYPLKPSQLTLISMFTIGVPSFVLSLEPNSNRIKGTFLGNVFRMAAPAGITTFISVSSLVIFGEVFKISPDCISTSSTMLVALVGFMILAKVAVPLDRVHVTLIAVMVAGMAYCVFFKPELFGIEMISLEAAMLLIVFLMATEALFRYIHGITAAGAAVITKTKQVKTKKQIRRGKK